MANPTHGFRTLKGIGSRLLRDEDDDWINVQAREGTSGWKKGLLFLRVYAYQDKTPAGGAQHLYRYECLRLSGFEVLAMAHGRTNQEARSNLYDELKRKGIMPLDEEQQ